MLHIQIPIGAICRKEVCLDVTLPNADWRNITGTAYDIRVEESMATSKEVKTMKTIQISLNSIDKVKSFVNDITKFDYDFDLVSGRYVIDAKSIMGIFSLDLSKPIGQHPL